MPSVTPKWAYRVSSHKAFWLPVRKTKGRKIPQSALISLGAYRYFLQWFAPLACDLRDIYQESTNHNNHCAILHLYIWVSKVIPYISITFEPYNSHIRWAEQVLLMFLWGKLRLSTVLVTFPFLNNEELTNFVLYHFNSPKCLCHRDLTGYSYLFMISVCLHIFRKWQRDIILLGLSRSTF